jgi:hypothetical protein
MIVRLFPDERCPFLPVAVTSEARGTVLSEVRGTVHGADALRCAKRCAVRSSWRGAGRGVERCVARKKYSNFSSYNYGNAGRLPAICRRLPSCAIRLIVRPGQRLPCRLSWLSAQAVGVWLASAGRHLPSAVCLAVRPGLRLPAPAAVCRCLRLGIGWRGGSRGRGALSAWRHGGEEAPLTSGRPARRGARRWACPARPESRK